MAPHDFETALKRLERLSAEIRELELDLAKRNRERDELRAALRNNAAHGFIAEGAASGSLWPPLPTKREPTPLERFTVDVIRNSRITVDRSWLARRLNISIDAAAIRLARCHAKGLLERPAKGKYFAATITEDDQISTGVVPSVPIGEPEDGEGPKEASA